MKVILINPPAERIIEHGDAPPIPHLGLAYLGAYVREKGIDIAVVDAKFEKLHIEQVVERVTKFSPDIIGFTAMTNYVKASANLAERVKQIFPQAIFLIGGAHPTGLPVETLKEFAVFDIAAIGEGEETLFEIAVSTPDQWHLIPGITFRKNGTITQNDLRRPIRDIDSLPFPAWDLFPAARFYPVFTSRGCPFRCIFCMRMLGSNIRLRSPDNVVQEIKFLIEKYHIRFIPFLDEIFTVNKERIWAICDLMIKEGIHKKITWWVNSRVTGVTYEMFKKMRAAGCRKVDFGIESGNNDILKQIKKDITVKDAMQAIALAKKARLMTHGLFILGHPNETKKTIDDTIKLAVSLNTTYLSVGIMVPYPGTEVYNMAKATLGGYRLISNNWNDYNKQIGNALELEGLDRKTLERFQVMAYLKFYLYNFRIIALIKILFSFRRTAFFILKNKLIQR